MSDSEDVESPEEALLSQHRKEKKELQGKIQALKKLASKGDKKKKKDTNDEITKLESDLAAKHSQELKEFHASSSQVAKSEDKEVEEIENALASVSTSESQGRVSKAQKRRDKKSEQDKARLLEIEKQEEENKNGLRHLEIQKLKGILAKRNLMVKNISSDGDCLYNSIAHQLQILSGVSHSTAELRKFTSDILQQCPDDFMPFMINQKTGESLSSDEYLKYCQAIVDKPVWGGHIELKALSLKLSRAIEVVQAEGPEVLVGEEFKQEKPLVITYHRHFYGLGEHYNSTSPLEETD